MGRTLKIVGRIWILLGILPLVIIAVFGVTKYLNLTNDINRFDSEAKVAEQRRDEADRKKNKVALEHPNIEKSNLVTNADYEADKEYGKFLSEWVEAANAVERSEKAEHDVWLNRRDFVASVQGWIGYSLAWLLIATTVGVILLHQSEAKRRV
jgi:hypothetical protein